VSQENLYTFVGFAGPVQARRACGAKKVLAMPKTEEQRQALMASIRAALTEGYMSTTWPENTIWLGARWSSADSQWRWDDGTVVDQPIDWAKDEPSSQNNQEREPWLCMVQNGRVRDTDPPYSFGVFCESAPNGIGDATTSVSAAAWKAGDDRATAADMVRVSQVHAGGDDRGGSSQVRVFQDTADDNDSSGAGKVQGSDPSKTAKGMMEDIAAAIATTDDHVRTHQQRKNEKETNSWNSIEVHTAMPLVQEFSIPTGVKAPSVRLVKLLHWSGSALTLAAVVVLLVASLSLSLMRVQRFRNAACRRAVSLGVNAGHNRSPAYAQLREALQERFEAGEVRITEADTA
jgi:hypothetical protein